MIKKRPQAPWYIEDPKASKLSPGVTVKKNLKPKPFPECDIATGEDLDALAATAGIIRQPGETDGLLRNRLFIQFAMNQVQRMRHMANED